MANLTYRQATQEAPVSTTTKNAALTSQEIDGNFKSLNDELITKAPLVSPGLSGVPTAPTATAGTNTTQLATTAFVQTGLSSRQPLDATLTALSGVSTTANQLIYSTASDTFSTTSITAFGRSLIDDADAATARTTLGLGTAAVQSDDRYAHRSNNLSDLANMATARSNLGLGNVDNTSDVNKSVASAAQLTTARSINGTNFNGTQNITTNSWGTSRTLTIGNTGKSVDGSANVSWSLAEIGAAAATATVNLTGDQTIAGVKTFSSPPVVPGLNGGQLAGMRNKIINGKMEIAQRGTSFAAVGSGVYTLDRWMSVNTSAAVLTVSQQADVPSDNEFQNSLRVAVTTADTSIAAGDVAAIQQRIEGYNVRDLIGRTFVLRFRVRSSKTGIHCIGLSNSAEDRTYVAEYTVNAANTWEDKAITAPGGLITTGTWNWTNGTGLMVKFTYASGSTFNTTAGAWQTGNFYATANQVNCLDTIGNIFAITGVQLEVGSVATPFEHRPIGAELALCQRYYQTGRCSSRFEYTAVQVLFTRQPFPVVMRASPTMAIVAQSVSVNLSSNTLAVSTTEGFEYHVTSAGAGSAHSDISWTASAEL